jgi:glycosyltransferase involved in cell wall biosynthesis
MSDITAVINCHREGMLVYASLRSALTARHRAQAAGLTVDVLAVADCSDDTTLDVLSRFADVKILETSVDDLGLARNVAVSQVDSEFIAFLDGDDLWGPSWLLRAHACAVGRGAPAVWHPEANLLFGPAVEPCWLIHPDVETMEGDWVSLGLRNHWTSLSFAKREIYLDIPYRGSDVPGGFGYEDWAWNADVLDRGYVHRIVPGTAHLVRMNPDSLSRRTIAARALMMPSALFRNRIGWADRVGRIGVASASQLPSAEFAGPYHR